MVQLKLKALTIKRDDLFYFAIIIFTIGLLITLAALLVTPEIFIQYIKHDYHISTEGYNLYKRCQSISLMTGMLFILVGLPFIIIRGFSVQLLSAFIKRTSGVLHSLHPYSYHFLAAIIVASFLLLACFSLLVLKDFPNSGDEYAYVFQAKTFLQGRFYNNTHPVQEFFNLNHIFAREEKWFSRFPPGWPVVLMMGNLMKIPMGLINPLIGALSVLVFFLLAKRLYNENIAIVSCLSLILSSFFIFNSASYFSHNVCCFFILMFAYFSILYDENDRVIYILLAGGSMGFAFITRYYTALLCAIPIMLYILSRKKSKCSKYFFYCAIGAAPLIALLMFYNYRITGNPFLLVTQWGVPNETLGFVRGHNLFKGLWYVCLHLVEFIEWTSPFMFFLYIGGLFLAVRKKNAFYFDLMFVFLVFGYMFWYSIGGNRYGPRFYYEAYPFVILAVVSNLDLAFKDKVLRDFLVGIFSVGFFVAVCLIPFVAVQEHDVIDERVDVFRQVKEANIDNAIIFLRNGTGVQRPLSVGDLVRNGVSLKGTTLYARDRGPRNVELKKYFPQKEFYVYARDQHTPHGILSSAKFD